MAVATKGAFALFKPSKEAVFRNLWPFLLFIFLPAFLSIIGDAVGGNAISYKDLSSTVLRQGQTTPYHLIGGLLAVLFMPAGYYLELQAAKGHVVSASDAFKDSLRFFWRLVGVLLLSGVIILLGLLALIVPGIIFIQRYFLAPYFLIDRDLGIKEALKASARASKGHGAAIWGIIGVVILFSVFNLIPIFGGLIAGLLIMLYTCAPAFRYLELAGSPAKSKSSKKAT